jgi:zinc protease
VLKFSGSLMISTFVRAIRQLATIALCATAVGASAFAAAKLPPTKPLQVPEFKYEKYTLPNGLTVLLHEDHRLPLVAVDLWYHVGPVNETAGRTGFAHLFEHMMFEGSEHVGEKAHIKYLEGAGATDVNGTTDFDRTNYFETLPSNQVETGLWLESDRMGFLLETLDRAKLTNQRDVVRNELRQDENIPYDLADEATFHLLFPKTHPYYASVVGSHADVEAARLNDVRDFFHNFYTPNNANLAIAGDFKTAELKALIVKYFGPLKRGPDVAPVNIQTPAITSERKTTITDTVQLPRVSVSWLTAPAFQQGDAEAILLARILGQGKSSRLYRKLVYEKQIAQSVNCSLDSLKLASVLGCDVTARPGTTVEQLQAAIDEELDKLRKEGPTQAELDGARNQQLSRLIGGLQRLGGFGGIADRMDLYNYYLGNPGYLPKDIKRYQAVTVASMTSVAQSTLGNNQRVVVDTVPGKKVTDDVPRSPADTDANVKITPPYTQAFEDEQNWRKEQPKPGPSPALHLPVPATFTLSNGLKVYLVEDHSLPVLSATVLTRAGGEANPKDKPGLSGFTAAMLTEGTKDRSATELADQVDQLGAQLTSAGAMDSASAGISGLSNTTDASFDLLSDVVEHPAFSTEEVERVRKQRLTSILQEGDQPVLSTLRVGLKALYGDQPYGYRPVGTIASVKAITHDDLTSFWQQHYGPQAAALIIAGDVKEAEAHRLAEHYFQGWSAPDAKSAPQLPAAPDPPTRKVLIVDKPGSPQTVLIAFGLGVPRTAPDYAAVGVMNDIFGGLFSSRLNMNLREQHGYTYGAFSQFAYNRDGGPMFVGAQVRTDVTAPAAKELFAEFGRIRTDPATPAELKLARDSELRSLPGHFETVAEVTANIGEIFNYGFPVDYFAKLPAQYEAVTPEVVEKAAQQDIHPDHVIVVAVGDRAKIEPGLKELNLGPIEFRDPMGNPVVEGAKP